MACNTMKGKMPDGTPYAVIVCGPRGRKPKPCRYCSRPHTKLCDFKLPIPGGWKACDAPLCAGCAVSVGEDKDHCRAHALRGDKEAV